ncbi:MAG TPA: GAP family protein [Actinomycetota bacterium]|nr:GAP family protein [Actinomycetota bacterium]
MGGLIVECALLGLVLTASSPIAIMGVLVMMPSKPHGMRSAAAFVAGWACVLLAIGLLGILGPSGLDFSNGSTASTVTFGLQLGLGIASLGYAIFRYRRLRARGAPPPPKWLARAGTVPPLAAFGLGALLPYYVVAIACVTEILNANVSVGGGLVAYLAFLLVTTGLLASPLIVVATSRDRSPERLAAMQHWLDRNSGMLITLLVALIGLLLITRGGLGLLQS